VLDNERLVYLGLSRLLLRVLKDVWDALSRDAVILIGVTGGSCCFCHDDRQPRLFSSSVRKNADIEKTDLDNGSVEHV